MAEEKSIEARLAEIGAGPNFSEDMPELLLKWHDDEVMRRIKVPPTTRRDSIAPESVACEPGGRVAVSAMVSAE